ncbi:class I SAM-dependent DNA methyltransferase [Yimella sp. RIT 621]|uniref:HsdM family class I SAM-dependent methyltransferase n=1 Tax=Yimella sp. RIT 621 TaxID=2510323 RepID=UPI001F0EE5A6|nr:N-6 DNA methylase [Yimella sp. RIT 621]
MTTPLPQEPDTGAARKARGAFFTPRVLCDWVSQWAIRSVDDVVLEPSCGNAEFLLSAGRRLFALGGSGAQLRGAELHPASAWAAAHRLEEAGFAADIHVGDFFDVTPTRDVSAVVGNPPYVRYQGHSGEDRVKSRRAALSAGVRLTALASSWAAFTVHSAEFLAPGGRLGLVVPAELLSTNYAAAVRRYLLEKFASVTLVMFEDRVFPGVEVEAVLLLADGFGLGPTDHFTVTQVRDAAALAGGGVQSTWAPASLDEKWTPSLIAADALSTYRRVVSDEHWSQLSDWGETSLGAVTGHNKWFTMTSVQAADLALDRGDLVRISPTGSRHLRGLELTAAALNELDAAGQGTWLFRPPTDPSPAASRRISAGQEDGVDQRYKCRVRKPWWRVPVLAPPDLFLTYMNADTPRLVSNSARVLHLNSIHGVYVRKGQKELARELLPLASINSITMLAAETVGRAYGGGMLKIEPREADLLPVPAPELLRAAADELRAVKPSLGQALRGGDLLAVAKRVDDILLVQHLGLKRADLARIRAAHATLSDRRKARSKG